jgi:type VI secretion system secreted protein VgrG
MIAAAKPQYALANLDPFAFVLVWSNYIATKGSTVVNQVVNASAPAATWSYAGHTVTLSVGKYLWYQLDDADDANQEWLVSVDCFYTDAAGRPSNLRIPKDRVSVAGAARFAMGGHSQIAIDLSAADMSVIDAYFTPGAGNIRFQLTVNVTIGWTNGFSLGGINLITVADKALWDVRTKDGKAQTLMHELGHKVGMTPDGTGRLPRKPSCYYTGQGHQGPHCSKGANYNAATRAWAGAPQCVMYGASHAARPRTFCAECAPLVRKLDMSPTMPGFTTSLANV